MGSTDRQVARIRQAIQQRPDPTTVEVLAGGLSLFPNIVAMLRG